MVRAQNKINENLNYPDTGCVKAKIRGYHGKCLDCPFPQCLEDVDTRLKPEVSGKRPPIRKRKNLAQRNEEIRKLKKEGVSVPEIAGKYGLCEATIWAVCRGC